MTYLKIALEALALMALLAGALYLPHLLVG